MSVDIFALVKTALDTLSPAVPHKADRLEGTLPDLFITYVLITGVPTQHADNVETARTYRVQVNIMSRVGLSSLPDVDSAMSAQGFTRGPERQLPKDSTTSHYGLAKDYFYLDN